MVAKRERRMGEEKTKGGTRQQKKAAGKQVDEGIEEHIDEAVQETVSAWRRLLRPTVIVTTIVFILLLIFIYFAFKLYATISQDLVIVLAPNAKNLLLEQGESGRVSFTLATNNYLFCEASCSYRLEDISQGKIIAEKANISLQDTQVNFNFSLDAPEKGEGQALYLLRVECANTEQALCRRESTLHKASAPITLTYRLSDEREEARERARTALPLFLAESRQLDILIQELRRSREALAADNLDGIERRIEVLVEERPMIIATAERLVAAWNEERYEAIAIPSLNETFREALDTEAALVEYLSQQNALVGRLEGYATTPRGIAVAHLVHLLLGEEEDAMDVAGYIGAIIKLRESVAQSPAETVLSRTEELDFFEEQIGTLTGTAEVVLKEEIEKGGTLLNRTANESGTTNQSDGLIATYDAYRALCDEMATVTSGSNSTNMTARAAYLARCDQMANVTLDRRSDVSLTRIQASDPSILNSSIPEMITEQPPICCLYGDCQTCCDSVACERRPPIIFLHGHSMNERNAPEYSLEAFKEYQELLKEEGLWLDGGIITPYDSYAADARGAWAKTKQPVSMRGTYYYDAYLKGDSYILHAEKSESIDTYAIRLKDLIDTMLLSTGAKNVTIVAHSMGGLVARRYMSIFGEERVDQIIIIATPNHGTKASVASICPFLGANKECEEMKAGSPFLARLNDPNQQPAVKHTVILGRGCDTHGADGDGVVTVESAELPWVESVIVNGTCDGAEVLHTTILERSKHPEVYAKVRELLLS